MEKTNFWNDAAKYGAILGVILAASSVLETTMVLSGSLKTMYLVVFEWLAVVILHYYLLHRYTRNRSMLYSAEEGFNFGQGYGFILVISAFAGIITGVVQYVHIHVILGYANYVSKISDVMTNMISMSGGNASVSSQNIIMQALEQIKTSPEPSVISTVWGGIWVSLLFGALFGLIIAGVLARAPKPFEGTSGE